MAVKLSDGDRVRFAEPLVFEDDEALDEFIYRHYDRTHRFYRPLYSSGIVYDQGTRYRIPDWRTRQFTIVASNYGR